MCQARNNTQCVDYFIFRIFSVVAVLRSTSGEKKKCVARSKLVDDIRLHAWVMFTYADNLDKHFLRTEHKFVRFVVVVFIADDIASVKIAWIS